MGYTMTMKQRKLHKELISCSLEALDGSVPTMWENGSEMPMSASNERLGGLQKVIIINGLFD
jgi:hypothetical protein